MHIVPRPSQHNAAACSRRIRLRRTVYIRPDRVECENSYLCARCNDVIHNSVTSVGPRLTLMIKYLKSVVIKLIRRVASIRDQNCAKCLDFMQGTSRLDVQAAAVATAPCACIDTLRRAQSVHHLVPLLSTFWINVFVAFIGREWRVRGKRFGKGTWWSTSYAPRSVRKDSLRCRGR